MMNQLVIKKLISIAIALVITTGICHGQSYWKRTIDGHFYSVCAGDGNNAISVGYTDSTAGRAQDAVICKFDIGGKMLWRKTYGGKNNEGALSVISSGDSNYLVAGFTSSFGAGGSDVYLLKINRDGDTLWTKTYGGQGADGAYELRSNGDGNYMVLGTTSPTNSGITVYGYILIINSDGDTLRTYTTGRDISDYSCPHISTQDSSVITVCDNTIRMSSGSRIFLDTSLHENYWANEICRVSNILFVCVGELLASSTEESLILSIVDDGYAYKDSLFVFKIPVSDDSTRYSYNPIKIPAG
jgi:hypothetical protein